MAEQKIQVNRELQWLDAKEPDPILLYAKELKGRSVHEESHMFPIRSPPQGSICVHGVNQNPKVTNNCLPPCTIQSTAASISAILPQSS